MAAATATKTEYGYSVTGGVDATTIHAGRARVKALAFMGNANDATCALTTIPGDGSTAVAFMKFKTQANDLDPAPYVFFGDNGIPVKDLAVTLSNTSDLLLVILT